VNAHLPALLIAVPLMAAPICLLLRNATVVRVFAVLVSWSCLAIAIMLLRQIIAMPGAGEIEYALGGWTPEATGGGLHLGIEYAVDKANAYILLIVSGIAAVVMPFGMGERGLSGPEGKEHLFYAAFLLCLCGLMGIAITGDIFNIFVFLEVSALSAYALIAMGQGRRAVMAAFSYLVMGTIGGTFILIGIGFIYALTGTLNMDDIRVAFSDPAVLHTKTAMVAFGFLLVGSSIKLAVFPVHQWLPNAYSFAPSKVSAFLSATATKVTYYVLLRVSFGLFGLAYVLQDLRLDLLLMPVALIAMFVGSTAAIYQSNLKRLLAYSSVAQIGYMVLGLSLANVTGLTGGLVHLFNHALMKCGLFLVAGCVVFRLGSSQISEMKGFARRMPLTFAAFVVGGLSMIGVPGTVGFVSKWYLVLGALEADLGWVAGLTLLSSLLAVVYIWKIIEVGLFQKPDAPVERNDVPLTMLAPTWILMGAAIYFGVDTELTVGIASDIAQIFLGATP
jgi:multicomponent Na+:H+ antiporter subunit D